MARLRIVVEAVVLALVGALVGVALDVVSPRPVALGEAVYAASASGAATCGGAHGDDRFVPAPMSQADAVAACASCSVGFVDARGAAAFAAGHVTGAVHLPPEGHADEREAFGALRKLQTVVVYDAGNGCAFALNVARRLRAAGFADVRILDGSWESWQAAGGPAESGACASCSVSSHAAGGQ